MSFDNVLQQFDQSFQITNKPNDTNKCHPRYNEYKNNALNNTKQDERRNAFLRNQHKNRFDLVMKYRQLLSEDEERSVKSDDQSDRSERMDVQSLQSLVCTHKSVKRKQNKYSKQLMLSEWLVEVPQLLQTDWYLVLCPVGKRCLVIASKGVTKAYSRSGVWMNSFVSLLPGGNRKALKDHKESCIVDCIYCENERCFYILDAMCWNGAQLYHCETEFRFYWLHSKINVEYMVSQTSDLNRYQFHVLKHFACDEQSIRNAIESPAQFTSQLDGLLFYHKRTHYTPGVTPLVNWLKLDMITDILGISLKDKMD